jgi:hypothetical protein
VVAEVGDGASDVRRQRGWWRRVPNRVRVLGRCQGNFSELFQGIEVVMDGGRTGGAAAAGERWVGPKGWARRGRGEKEEAMGGGRREEDKLVGRGHQTRRKKTGGSRDLLLHEGDPMRRCEREMFEDRISRRCWKERAKLGKRMMYEKDA